MSDVSISIICAFISLSVYLFITAPPELPEAGEMAANDRPVDVTNMFNAMNAINDTARQIYTSKIVGEGKKAGLAFGEDWAEPEIVKGPLPALFLRLVAARMETKSARLGLYLGSDEPINKSNLFSGKQASAFEILKANKSPVFLETAETGFIAMYPDLASVEPCVTCHNEHPDSPKTDWKLDEVMGATTWTYPRKTLGSAEYLEVTEAVYDSVEEAYQLYLTKISKLAPHVTIADAWPTRGQLSLPNAETFMAAVRQQSAMMVLNDLVLDATAKFQSLDLESTQ